MKILLLLICCIAFHQNFALAKLNGNDDGIIGVSQKKLKDYMTKFCEGFRHIIKDGDDELNYPVMEPLEVEDASWEYIDRSISKKHSLIFTNTDQVLIEGLSAYNVSKIDVSAKDLKLNVQLLFSNVTTVFPYNLNGYLLKKFMPIFGNGTVQLIAPNQVVELVINLGIEQGFIVIEDVQASRSRSNIDIKVNGFMDLAEDFASFVIDDILDQLIKEHGQEVLTNFAMELIEDAVGGMTTEEFFDYLDYVVKKNDEQ